MQTASIEVINKPSRYQFRLAFEKRRKPVVIKGLLDDWPAMHKWNTDYLREKIGDVVVPVRVKPKSAPPGFFAGKPDEKLPMKQMSVSEYIDLFEKGETTDVYLAGTSIPDYFPELEKDIPLLPYIDLDRKLRKQFWLGIKGTVAPLHLDIWDNFLCQLTGGRRLVLFDPRDVNRLYPYGAFSSAPHISKINLDTATSAEFPLLDELVGYEAIVEPGDVLYMPPGWWHQVWTTADSIAVNFWWFQWQTALAPWFVRYYPFLATQYKRHQKVQGRLRSPEQKAA